MAPIINFLWVRSKRLSLILSCSKKKVNFEHNIHLIIHANINNNIRFNKS